MKNEIFERLYAASLSDFLMKDNDEITVQHNRTGVDTLVKLHMFFIAENVLKNFPVLKGKKVYPYMALKELLWMLSGRTDVKWLNDRGVTYWDEWVKEDGTIGKSYGHQFRNFNGIDLLLLVIDRLLHDTMSRRIILSLWNPNDLKEMALEPCQYDFHFTCEPDKSDDKTYTVHLHAHMRSTDSFLGLPYDIMFDSLFLTILCHYCTYCEDNKHGNNYTYNVGNIYMTCDNYHLYTNHKDAAELYVKNACMNEQGIIDSWNYITMQENNNDNILYKDFDSFLKLLINDSDSKERKVLKIHNTKDIYGPIKADIAI